MQDIGSFAATARVKVGSRRGACIATEQDRLFVAYVMGGGVWLRRAACRSLAVAMEVGAYVGIAPELALAKI